VFRGAFASHFAALQSAVNAFDSEQALSVLEDAMALQNAESVR